MKPRKESQRDNQLAQDVSAWNFSNDLHITTRIIRKCLETLGFQTKFESPKDAKINDLFFFFLFFTLVFIHEQTKLQAGFDVFLAAEHTNQKSNSHAGFPF